MDNTQKANHNKVRQNHEMLQDFFGLSDGVYGLASMLQNHSNDLMAEGKYNQLDKLVKELIVATNEVENVMYDGNGHS
jgi:hypothetical protein